MFRAVELGRKLSKQAYAEEEPKLHTALLEAQRKLRTSTVPVILIVSGVEGAGKSEVVNQLHAWLDTRGLQTHAFWDDSDEERQRPRYWRFWRALPARGSIGIMFGSWYTQPVIDRVYGRIGANGLDRELQRIVELEQLLTDDGALIVKLWFHLSKQAQEKRLSEELGKVGKSMLPKFGKHYDEFTSVSERAIRVTDTGPAPWTLIEAADRRYRDLTAGQTLLAALNGRLGDGAPKSPAPSALLAPPPTATEHTRTVLDTIDLTQTLEQDKYEKRLDKLQGRLRELAWTAKKKELFTVIVFEGWDAAGKGGAIRRLTAAIDARLYRVISIAAPTDEEKAHHYLWRFWRQLPRAGYVTIYDRSWYGRVLVERVEGFAREDEWRRAYQEINDFEEQLVEHGVALMKFWLHISPDEQLRRFKERQEVAWKQHKITDEDWRNRDKLQGYESAVNEMVVRTSTEYAPWTLVPANDKRLARVEVLRTVCERLEARL